jgi:hypothetical protein
MARIVGGLFVRADILTRRFGAIAQLGERVVRNDEVGGSIPPGSTTLRASRGAACDKPEKRSMPGKAQRAKTGD